MSSMSSVKVAVRIRPLNRREQNLNGSVIIHTEGSTTFITNVKLPGGSSDALGRERVKQFTFDHSYLSLDPTDPNYASQEQVFRDLGADVIDAAYQGYNTCIFAYGQTGSGKTFTMMGEPQCRGLIPRISEKLYDEMKDPETTYRAEVSYLEIYNERVRDLLRVKTQPELNLRVREHPKDGPYVQDLSKHLATSYTDVLELIERGNHQRTTASTNMNEQSSRSHAIFTVTFTQAKFSDEGPSEINSKIHLVDLAGSERADSSGATGDRLKEGGSINKSLVTLGSVISSLADMSEKLAGIKKNIFIPYRDSVLTWILKDSLGGNAKTIMIATVSPADCNYAETLSTLRYASRAKKIVNKPTINEDPNVKLIRELRQENSRLRALLGETAMQDVLPSMREFAETREKLSRNEEKVRVLTEKWTDKWQETANILQEHVSLGLRKEGTGVVLDSELPYILAVDDNILSTGMRLYHIKEGDTSVGREDAGPLQDIALTGKMIEAEHCIIRHRDGEVTLIPLDGALCSVNNIRVHEPTKLSQGSIIRLGRGHLFRFNHPCEAAKLREEMKGTGSEQLIRVWQDYQWTWSSLSIADSAVGSASDLDLDQKSYVADDDDDVERVRRLDISCSHHEELQKLEEKREELVKLEESHVLAEARRLSSLAEAEAARTQDTEPIHSSTLLEAEKQILEIATDLEQRASAQSEHERCLQQEETRLQRLKEKLEKDKARARAERRRLRRQREQERARRSMERERTEIEWAEIEMQKKMMEKEYEEQQRSFSEEKLHQRKLSAIEQDVYQTEMTRMRELVEAEVKDMRVMAGLPAECTDSTSSWCTVEPRASLERLKLRLSPIADSQEQSVVDTAKAEAGSLETGNNVKMKMCAAGDSGVCDLDGQSVADEMEEVTSLVTDLHNQVCRTLRQRYSTMLATDDHTEGLANHILSQFTYLRPRFHRLEKFVQSSPAHSGLVHTLASLDRLLNISDKFLQVHEVLRTIEVGTAKCSFLRSIEQLEAVNNVLGRVNAEEEQEKKLHRMLQTEVCIQREKLLYHLGETWNCLVQWEPAMDGIKSPSRLDSTVISLGIADGQGKHELLVSVAQAMFSVGMLDSRIKALCDRLLNTVMSPIVHKASLEIELVDEADSYKMRFRIPATNSSNPVSPEEVFKKLEKVFLFLHRPMHTVIVKEVYQNQDQVSLKKVVTLVEKIGLVIHKKLFEMVYSGCLSAAIPKTGAQQWQKFNDIILKIEQFEETLEDLEFLEPQHESLMDFLNNVNHLFANMKSQDLLRRAHELMSEDLLSYVRVSGEHPTGRLEGEDGGKREAYIKQCRENAATTNYKLPSCCVSSVIQALVHLAYDTLHEAQSGSHEGAQHLLHSLCTVFDLFCDVIPAHHADKLLSLPLLAALQHNNCMFIAHHLITLDRNFQLRLFPDRSFTPSRSTTPSSWAPSPIEPSTPVAKTTPRSTVTPGRTMNLMIPHTMTSRSLTRGRSLTPSRSLLPTPSPSREVMYRSGSSDKVGELVRRVRKVGNEGFSQHIAMKTGQLHDVLSRAQGFSCVADDDGAGALSAVQDVLSHLHRVSVVWRGVLPINIYCRALGRLLHGVIKEIIHSVLIIEEFSVEDCECLLNILDSLLKSAPDLFAESTPSSVVPEVTVHEFVPSWSRLKELVLLLGSGLQDVSDRWADGKGPLALHFTVSEVTQVVCAMFENTRKRDNLIRQLKQNPSVHGRPVSGPQAR